MAISNDPEKLVRAMLGGSRGALARLISLAEGGKINTARLLAESGAKTSEPAIIGITGPPGAGKSTLADGIVGNFRKRKLKVGAVVIDPSSPFTGGALLGDRVRMANHADDEGVFIRSLGSRGAVGGLSRAVSDIIRLMGAFGVNRILIETVGVGQSELDIAEVADTVIVVLVPESGDSIQTMKAGIMEIGDIFVVNKADRKNSQALAAEIRGTLSIRQTGENARHTPVLLTKAASGQGVAELCDEIENHRIFLQKNSASDEKKQRRIKKELARETNRIVASLVGENMRSRKGRKITADLIEGRIPLSEAAGKIAALITGRGAKQ